MHSEKVSDRLTKAEDGLPPIRGRKQRKGADKGLYRYEGEGIFSFPKGGEEVERMAVVFWPRQRVASYEEAVLNGVLHRESGPAVEWADGSWEWWLNGRLHREDGPAIQHLDPEHGLMSVWFRHGEQHREDGPGAEWADGQREWWINGQLHRDNDLPAVIEADGSLSWYQHGELHRENGLPAFVGATGQGVGWWKHGEEHRDGDEPACVEADGTMSWYKDGQRHRICDQPAVVAPGREVWYWRGFEHRKDGKPSSVWRLGDRTIIGWADSGFERAQLVLTDYNEPCLTVFSEDESLPGEYFTDFDDIAEVMVAHDLILTGDLGLNSDHELLLCDLRGEMMLYQIEEPGLGEQEDMD